MRHIFVNKFWRTLQFHEIFKNISTYYPCCNHTLWIIWKTSVRATYFCKEILADFTVSRNFQKYFNFIPMPESRNVNHVKANYAQGVFLWKHSGGHYTFMSFSKIFQLSFHATIKHCKSYETKCSWNIFLWKNSGGLQCFVKFSKIFQFSTHARITKCKSCESQLCTGRIFVKTFWRTL